MNSPDIDVSGKLVEIISPDRKDTFWWCVLVRRSAYSCYGVGIGMGTEPTESDARQAAFECAERFCLDHSI